MQWNLLWFVPVGLFLWGLAIFDFAEGLQYARAFLRAPRPFAALFSLSTYFWLVSTLSSVAIPLEASWIIPGLFDPAEDDYDRRYRYVLFFFGGAVILTLITWVFAWGSFPFENGADGYVHLRMIPFVPWPQRPL